MNADFAQAGRAELERRPDAAVFFHDYHLYLAPRLVRDRRPDAALTHFVHIPWPQPDYWRVFPRDARCAIHDGLIANDVVGFHTERWRRNFIYSVRELLGEASPRRRTRTRPISVDPAEFEELAQSPAVLSRGARAHRHAAGAADRPRRPDRSVEEHRSRLPRVRALSRRASRAAPASGHARAARPFAAGIPEYAEYLAAIQREARRVNDRFQQDGWRPIELEIADDFAQSVAAYKQFDVLLVNAIFDGMNLVAKEGAARQRA